MSPFTRCEKGHDLTQPDAHIYDASGNRKCRACVQAARPGKREKVAYGAFEGGMPR